MADYFRDGIVANHKSPQAQRLLEFARGLLTIVAALHQHQWRLGLTDPENLYLIEGQTTQVFLPDLGFAWVGTITLAKPSWLKEEATDLDLWAEDRGTRQYAAPTHYRKYLPDADWEALVQKDLRLVARLFRFVLTGQVKGSEPARAGHCPVWRVIHEAEAGRFVTTENASAAEKMLHAMLTRLGTRGAAPPPPSSNWGAVLAFLLLIVGGSAVGLWWLFFANAPNPMDAGKDPPDRPRPDAIAAAAAIPDLAERARAALQLRQDPNLSPEDKEAIATLLARMREELLEEIRKNWAAAQKGEHLPLRTRELMDLLNQIPEAPNNRSISP